MSKSRQESSFQRLSPSSQSWCTTTFSVRQDLLASRIDPFIIRVVTQASEQPYSIKREGRVTVCHRRLRLTSSERSRSQAVIRMLAALWAYTRSTRIAT